MRPLKIALIFNAASEYTTGNYFRDVLEQQGAEFQIFTPAEQRRIPAAFNLRFYIDDGTHYAIYPVQGVLKVLYLIDTHTSFAEDEVMSRMADVVFCAQKSAADAIGALHPAVYWLPLACDPAVHYRHVQEKIYDIAFIGGVADPRRAGILAVLEKRYPSSFIGRAPRDNIGEIYSSSKIVFNIAYDNDLNMRFFEGLCSGSLLLTDVIANSGMDFLQQQAPSPFCVLYRDLDSLLEKIDFYLQHDADRERIAREGRIFSRSHRYADRWGAILAHIEGLQSRSLGLADYLACRFYLAGLRVDKVFKRLSTHGK